MTLALDNALKARARYSAFMLRVVHSDATVTRLNTGFRNIDWDDGDGEEVWKGCGHVLGLTLPEQANALEVSEFELSLSGLSSDYRWMAAETVRGLPVTITLAFIGDNGQVVASETVEQALQDRVSWQESEDMRSTITLHCLGGVAFIQNQVVGRWSPEPHRAWLVSIGEDPDSDTGFDAQAGIPDDASAAAWWPPS